jgi:hypothetical protein
VARPAPDTEKRAVPGLRLARGVRMKTKPCKAPRTRHDWEHYANKTTQRRFADGSVELRRRGIWYCTACKTAKYGEPREQVHVVVVA